MSHKAKGSWQKKKKKLLLEVVKYDMTIKEVTKTI